MEGVEVETPFESPRNSTENLAEMQPDQQEVDQTPEPKQLRQPEDLADLRESVRFVPRSGSLAARSRWPAQKA